MFARLLLLLGFIPWLVHSLAATDSTSDADPPQSGYLPNHNMHPSVVGSSIFGILWQNTYGSKEKWYAKPLVFTPAGKTQLVFLASSMNWIRTVDAVTGTAINQRQVQPPFLQSDIGCTDIPDYIGIIGTPIIDPASETVYFFSKGYKGAASGGGVANGIYQFYAVNINDLTDRPGFPVLIDGHNADNDPARYFVGGTVLQRPALALIGGTVFGAFGGHCDKYNYTGMVVGVSTANGGVTSMFAMESSPGAPAVVSDINVQQGGKAGIWMGGMAPATDGSRLFVVTGNGQGHENKDTPASGRTLLSTLDEVVANFAVSGGKLSLQDYFEPYEYIGMDAGDRDLGSGGCALLDPSVFKGTGVSRVAVTIGKNGKAYIMNADNLGGFKLGPGGTDNILQTIVAPGSVFGGSGSYPLEGGYIYFTPVGSPTLVYALGRDQNGVPLFSKVGQSPENSAGRVGVGVPTITSYKGQAGTGILWVTDVDAGLKAYKAVPDSTGNLVRLTIPPTGGLNKFQRPAFGDGRLYVSDNNGRVICLGSPVSLPLNCTQPVNFGDVSVGSTATVTVNCTALIGITKINGLSTLDPTFQASNASLPQGSLNAGDTFSFPVTWNLTQAAIKDAQNASFGSVSPGVKSTSLTIYTTNAVAKYSNSLPISLQGNEVSNKPFLSVSPNEVDFGGLVIGSSGAPTGLDSAFIITNAGQQALTITGYGYTVDLDPPVQYTNITKNGTDSIIGIGFTSSDLPAVGSIFNPGQSLTVPANFKASTVGNYRTILQIWTNGGTQYVLFTASATTAPIAELTVETSEGGWDPSGIMNFGQVLAGNTVTRRIRICNKGGSALMITKSKPPIQPELRAENPTSDLHEGQFIPVNTCAYGPVDIAAAPETANTATHSVSDTWTLNTDDLSFGVHEVQVSATIISRQLGPTNPDGTPKYQYLGCYADGSGRLLQKSYNLGSSNENGLCQQTCLQNGYRFAGTEYHIECWCGNNPPLALKYTPESAKKCTFGCANDTTQACGGDGTYLSLYYDASKYTPDCSAVPCSSSSSSSTVMSSTSSIISSSTGSTVSSSTIDSGSLTTSSSISSSAPSSISTTSSVVSSTSAAPTPTGPVINPGNADYTYKSCYGDGLTKAINPSTKYANNSMTVQVCLDFCKSKGTVYAGIEYRRECYCGNTLAADAVPNATGCTMLCYSNATEYCGGSLKMQLYQKAALVSSTTTSASSAPSSSSALSSSAFSVSSSSTSLIATSSLTVTSSTSSSLDPASSSASSTGSSSMGSSSATDSSTSSSSSPLPSSTTTSISSSLDPSSSSSSSSSSPTTISSSSSSSTDSSTSSTPPPTSTTSSTTSSAPATTLATTTSTSTTTTTPPASPSSTTTPTPIATQGFFYSGCYAEPLNAKAMKQLAANDSMTVEFCIAAAQARLAAKPATTYRYVGVEYGRECYGATAAVTSAPSLVGNKACTLACMGNSTERCGGRGMYNLYVSTDVSTSSTSSPVSTTGTVSATGTG